MQYTIIRSRRKTLSVRITADATVEVRAPPNLSMAYIDKFVASKKQWILTRLARQKQRIAEKSAFTVTYLF